MNDFLAYIDSLSESLSPDKTVFETDVVFAFSTFLKAKWGRFLDKPFGIPSGYYQVYHKPNKSVKMQTLKVQFTEF